MKGKPQEKTEFVIKKYDSFKLRIETILNETAGGCLRWIFLQSLND